VGAAIYCLCAMALAVGLVVALHFLEPEFDPSWRMLSEYSLGRYGVLMRVAFLAMGTAVIAVAVALGSAPWPGTIGLVLVAIGPVGAAFIDTDPVTTPRAEVSKSSKVHAALGSLFILGFPAAATAAGICAAGEPTVDAILGWASIGPWAGLAWFIGASMRYARTGAQGGPDVRVGWPNRVSMLLYFAWVALAAILVLS
jgi:uncharacterized protein DUF998